MGQIELVLAALDDAGVRWCLLRGEEHLSSLEGDLDMMVEARQADAARDLLLGRGFVAMPRLGRQDATSFVALADDGARWIRLDIASDLRIGGIHFPVADGVLARRMSQNGMQLLHPHDRFWSLLLHSAWDHEHLGDRHRRRLRDLLPYASGSGPFTDQLLRWDITEDQLDGLRQCVAAEGWEELDRRLGAIRRRGLGGQRPLAPGTRIGRRLRSVVRRALLGATRPGMSIALLGPDGSGKSSLTTELCRSLPAPTRRLYVGLYQRHRARMPVPGLGFAFRLWRLAGIGLQAGYHQARGRVVIFDRHPIELGIDMSPRTGALSRLRRWVLSRIFPAADVTIVLDAPAELLSARKPEHTHEDARRQQEGYLGLARHRAQSVISTTGSLAEARRRVVAIVWPRLAARARRRA